MEDIYSWSANHPKWSSLGKILSESRSKLNGQTSSAFEAFVESQPETERQQWHAFFSAYAEHQAGASPKTDKSTAVPAADAAAASSGQAAGTTDTPFSLVRHSEDPLGRNVRRIHVDTDEFVIYCADDAKDPDDVCTLAYMFKPGVTNERAKAMRAGLCPIAAQIYRLADCVSSMKSIFDTARQRREQQRAFELMARAMQFGFEGRHPQAVTILDTLEDELHQRRDSKNRMRYIFANTVSFALIVLAGVVIKSGWTELFGPPLGEKHQTVIVDILLFGALGAFFSVVYDIKSVKVHHAITYPEMIYAGAVRIPVGVIAAAVVILLITGQWMLSGLDELARSWSLLLLGFLAGFSEMFVPNALKNVEERSTVSQPGGQAAKQGDGRGEGPGDGQIGGAAGGAAASAPADAPIIVPAAAPAIAPAGGTS